MGLTLYPLQGFKWTVSGCELAMKTGAGCCEDKSCEIARMAASHRRVLWSALPDVEVMGVIGASALGANLVCFLLLYRHRADNLNMSSTWICSRNDLIANAGVLLTAAACYVTSSQWPDMVVGGLIASLFLNSSFDVLHAAIRDFRKPLLPSPQPMKPTAFRFSKIER
jgi:hypothetical protein